MNCKISNSPADSPELPLEVEENLFDRMARVDDNLQTLEQRYLANIDQLATRRELDICVSCEADLGDMPSELKRVYEAKPRGWRFPLARQAYEDLLRFSPNRGLRRQMFTSYLTMGSDLGPRQFDNRPVLESILKLRHTQAKLLGSANHADWVFQARMLTSPDAAEAFLTKMASELSANYKNKFKALENFAQRQLGINDFSFWDLLYCKRCYTRTVMNYDVEGFNSYLRLDKALAVLLDLGAEFLELKFIKAPSAPEVFSYRVIDRRKNALIGILNFDLFSNDNSKKSNNWSGVAVPEQTHVDGAEVPVMNIYCNFIAGAEGQPPLTFEDIKTLFHEFGHAVEYFIKTPGDHTVHEWDLLEFYSQFFQYFVFDWEVFSRMTAHPVSGQKMPKNLFTQAIENYSFNNAFKLTAVLVYAFYDLDIHREEEVEINDKFLARCQALFLFSTPANYRAHLKFTHIVSPGKSLIYSAGYYQYLWSGMLALQVWRYCQQNNSGFDRNLGRRFRDEFLYQNGFRKFEESFEKFTGHKFQINGSGLNAFL